MTRTRHIAPAYDRTILKPRILHIGFGAFARAHMLVYLDEALSKGGGDWGVVATRLHSGVDALSDLEAAQNLYTVAEADDDTVTARTIGAVMATCHPLRDGHDALWSRFTDPALDVVSLTITEKGYCSRDGRLYRENRHVVHDLHAPDAPETAIGVIVAGLRRRRDGKMGGITVLSCDNLPENGTVARAAVLDFANALEPALAEWIEGNVTFPSTMVDRIVPALDDPGRALLGDMKRGKADQNGIVCEPFRQWVIEDRFQAARPPFDLGGADFVADVRPFEAMKLRMLNGAHSFLAWLGALGGHETIADCMADPVYRHAARSFMLDEQAPTLEPVPGVDFPAYGEALLTRFSNSRLKHRTTQIATDSSQKLPQRMLGSVRAHIERTTPWPLLALAIAGWIVYLRGKADDGSTLPLDDPLAESLIEAVSGHDGMDEVRRVLAIEAIFPDDLRSDPRFLKAIEEAHGTLVRRGARDALAAHINERTTR